MDTPQAALVAHYYPVQVYLGLDTMLSKPISFALLLRLARVSDSSLLCIVTIYVTHGNAPAATAGYSPV